MRDILKTSKRLVNGYKDELIWFIFTVKSTSCDEKWFYRRWLHGIQISRTTHFLCKDWLKRVELSMASINILFMALSFVFWVFELNVHKSKHIATHMYRWWYLLNNCVTHWKHPKDWSAVTSEQPVGVSGAVIPITLISSNVSLIETLR